LMTFVAALLVASVAFLATLMMSVPVRLLEGFKLASFRHFHVDITLLFGADQGFVNFANLGRLQGVGEHYLEDDEEVAELVGLFVIGHAVALHCLYIVWLDDLSGFVFDSDFAVVEVG